MAWETLGASRATAGAAAMISTSAGGGKLPPFLTLTLRLDLLVLVPAFVRPGGTCDVLFGRGSDAGKIRIVPGNRSSFFALGRGATQGRALTVRVRQPDGIAKSRRAPEAVEHQAAEGGIDLALPAWAVAVERVAPPSPRASIMDRVPDPAADLRGRR